MFLGYSFRISYNRGTHILLIHNHLSLSRSRVTLISPNTKLWNLLQSYYCSPLLLLILPPPLPSISKLIIVPLSTHLGTDSGLPCPLTNFARFPWSCNYYLAMIFFIINFYKFEDKRKHAKNIADGGTGTHIS